MIFFESVYTGYMRFPTNTSVVSFFHSIAAENGTQLAVFICTVIHQDVQMGLILVTNVPSGK